MSDLVTPTFRTLKYRIAGALALFISVLFLAFSTYVDSADWLSRSRSPESYKQAIRSVPEDWELYEGLAETSPLDGLPAMRQAVRLNPSFSGIRIDLASLAEAAGRFSEAEANLVAATSLDRTSISMINLAEFYFRRRDAEHFWPTARSAISMAKALPTLLLEDCWKLTSDSDLILEKVITDEPKTQISYLVFLLDQNHLNAAQAVAIKIMRRSSSEFNLDDDLIRRIMSRYCEELAGQNALFAVKIWNWQVANKLIPYQELSTKAGGWVTNSEFTFPPLSEGFDWKLGGVDGISIDYSPSRKAVHLSFSGKQPEHCEIINQFIPLWPGKQYRFRAYYDDFTMNSIAGLGWRVVLPSGAEIPTYPMAEKEGADKGPDEHQSFGFAGTGQPSIARLVMYYDRTPGTVKIEGEMQIRSVVSSLE